MRLLFNTKNLEILEIQLTKGKLVIDKTRLTIGQDLDIMLITTLDRIFSKNKLNRLSLKNVEIQGKMESNKVSSMVLSTVVKTLNL